MLPALQAHVTLALLANMPITWLVTTHSIGTHSHVRPDLEWPSHYTFESRSDPSSFFWSKSGPRFNLPVSRDQLLSLSTSLHGFGPVLRTSSTLNCLRRNSFSRAPHNNVFLWQAPRLERLIMNSNTLFGTHMPLIFAKSESAHVKSGQSCDTILIRTWPTAPGHHTRVQSNSIPTQSSSLLIPKSESEKTRAATGLNRNWPVSSPYWVQPGLGTGDWPHRSNTDTLKGNRNPKNW